MMYTGGMVMRRRAGTVTAVGVGNRVIGYIRVSTDEQGLSGLGLGDQRKKIVEECERKGWQLLEIIEDVATAKNMDRPGIARALEMLDRHEADVLVAAKLDRISRSTLDFSKLMERAGKNGWVPRVLDLGIDLTTPQGEAMAGVAAIFAQLERRMISDRTKAALAEKKAQGAKLGRPQSLPDEVISRIVRDYEAGMGVSQIARALMAEGVPTARGGSKWFPSTVQNVLGSQRAQELTGAGS